MKTNLPEKQNSTPLLASDSGEAGGETAVVVGIELAPVEIHQVEEEIERKGFFHGILQVGLNLKGFTLKFERKPKKEIKKRKELVWKTKE